ncbi:hypothetical protein HGP28_17245 [Vibrio sp. SM6]|uniref:DUF6701 domain-containing protein n=1 Tax=Vibrio agarilyticus TaxID=2726741 RepID=A0A7X8TTH3_9VIBR|nr:DUF6701 domain-containing protein [Vibrio agarilyticus]NLS14607.1 hypothetical protein [Vibrio agarilyticus]
MMVFQTALIQLRKYGLSIFFTAWALTFGVSVAAEQDFSEVDECQYLNAAVQTWDDSSENTLDIGKSGFIFNDVGFNVGFAESRLEQPEYHEPCTDGETGQKGRCKAEPNLIVDKPDFNIPLSNFTGTKEIAIKEGNYWEEERDLTLPRDEDREGACSGNVCKFKSVTFESTSMEAWIESGTYWIETFTVEASRKLSIKSPKDGPVYLHVKKLNLAGNVPLNFNGNPDNFIIKVYAREPGENPILSYEPLVFNNGDKVYARILSERNVEIIRSSEIHGAVVANSVKLDNSGYIYANSSCIDGNPSNPIDYSLSVTPTQSIALMCGNETPIFTINTKQDGKNASLSVNAVFNSDADNFELSVVDGIGEGSGMDFASNRDGQLKLQVTARDPSKVIPNQDYSLTFNLTNDKSTSQTVTFRMVPAKIQAFEAGEDNAITNNAIDTLSLVAGKATKVDFKVLACSANGTPVVAEHYKAQQLTWQHTLEMPSNGDKGTLTFAPQFTSGVAQSTVTLNEAGKFNLTLSDQFNCAGYQGCGDNDIWPLNGVLTLHSRPWTLAICPADDSIELNNGTASSGKGMIGAGEHFAMTVRPIIWQSGFGYSGDADNDEPININKYAEQYCAAPITKNVFSTQGDDFDVVLSSKLDSPQELRSGYKGALLEGVNGLRQKHDSGTGDKHHWRFDDLYWDNVGSLSVSAGLADDMQYLSMPINPGVRVLGRFYPKYFSVLKNVWHYPTHNGQTLPYYYMNQPIEAVDFQVAALSANDIQVSNYEYFAPQFQARFALADFTNSGRFPLLDRYVQGDGSNVWQGGVGSFAYQRTNDDLCGVEGVLCWSKQYGADKALIHDGPYNVTLRNGNVSQNTEIGIELIGSMDTEHPTYDDPIDYQLRLLPEKQPALRLGRAVLSSVGGAQRSTIAVPLTIEDWENDRFYTAANSQTPLPWDNYSHVDGKHYCRRIEWSDDVATPQTTNAQLSGEAQVVQGQSQSLIATQTQRELVRESVRFWLKLGTQAETSAECTENSNLMPWLQYDWDVTSSGEEDPSAVVTFGIYRGNDRVILRGENGILPN